MCSDSNATPVTLAGPVMTSRRRSEGSGLTKNNSRASSRPNRGRVAIRDKKSARTVMISRTCEVPSLSRASPASRAATSAGSPTVTSSSI